MKKNTVIELSSRGSFSDTHAELLRHGARILIQQAVEGELSGFLKQFANRILANGKVAIVRKGFQPERQRQSGLGPVAVNNRKFAPGMANLSL